MKAYRNEKWKLFNLGNCDLEKEEIMVSSYGRVKKKKKGEEEFKFYDNGIINNFETLRYYKKGKKKNDNYYVHRAMAQLFLEKDADDKRFVIHLNHDLTDNRIENLKWVNQKELTKHQVTNPKRIAVKHQRTNCKLTEGRVRLIKKKIFDPNRKTRMRLIAKQFGISEMQLYRIKSGENWGSVTDY
ncbi:HNH endonuclease [Tenacibaculum geojense]|uniref:HNH endonuclease n=1 Tax=Tenacibaculum geojense TaxID=915352 RepID=A0ABW3JTH9_9FLAO